MSELEFYRDERGIPCARGDDERLARFLETDLQGSEEVTQSLIKRLEATDERSEFNGNGHSVTISEVMVTIDSNFDDEAPDRRIPRDEFTGQLKAWQDFLTSRNDTHT